MTPEQIRELAEWVDAKVRLPNNLVNGNFQVKHKDGRQTTQYWNGTGFINFDTFSWNYFSDIVEWCDFSKTNELAGASLNTSGGVWAEAKQALIAWQKLYDKYANDSPEEDMLDDFTTDIIKRMDESGQSGEGDYWKQRCEAAENLMIDYDPLYPNGRKKDYETWQSIKSSGEQKQKV